MREESLISKTNNSMSEAKNLLRGGDKRHKLESDYAQIERLVEDKQKLVEETAEKIRKR